MMVLHYNTLKMGGIYSKSTSNTQRVQIARVLLEHDYDKIPDIVRYSSIWLSLTDKTRELLPAFESIFVPNCVQFVEGLVIALWLWDETCFYIVKKRQKCFVKYAKANYGLQSCLHIFRRALFYAKNSITIRNPIENLKKNEDIRKNKLSLLDQLEATIGYYLDFEKTAKFPKMSLFEVLRKKLRKFKDIVPEHAVLIDMNLRETYSVIAHETQKAVDVLDQRLVLFS